MKRNILVSILGISLALFISSCNSKEVVKENTDKVKITTIKVKQIEYNYEIITSGKIMSEEELKLSFKTGGVIHSILVNEGEKVNKGDVLATLNLSEINAMVNQAKLGLEKAKRDFERAKNLYNDSVATLEQYQNAKTALEYAKSSVEIAEFNRKYSSINAPCNGIILKRLAEENELIAQGYPVFLFGSTNKNWLFKANVVDKEIVLIEIGDKAVIEIDAFPEEKFKAEVIEIGKFADPYTGTYEVELKVDNNNKNFVSGLIAKAKISTIKKESFILIPYNSLIEANEAEGFIYKIIDGEIVKTSIKISKIIDEGILAKSNGLKQGDVIVNEGVKYIQPGIDFEIVK